MSDRPAPRIEPGDADAGIPDRGDVSGFVSASAAATALGVNERTIRRAIQRGELAAIKHGRSFQIPVTALDEFREARGQPRSSRPRLRLVEPVPADVEEAPAGSLPVPLLPPEHIRRSALPSSLTPFFGRGREIAALQALLARDDVRLLTLTGPGGIGKTRLALEAARGVSDAFADGAVFAPLAAVRDPAVVPSAIVQALGMLESDYLPPAERLAATLRDRRLLLILDNFEHVAAASSLVTALLEGCPGLTVLVTSRSLLKVSGEHAFVVPPLGLPAGAAANSLEELGQIAAVQLFVDRAQAAWPQFALTAENAPAVAAICSRVEGLPLAIELAAARSAVLSPATMLDRLAQRLPLLTGGPTDQPDRLRTMRDAIVWSYDLLSPGTQAHFRRLAVFAGGFTLEAAERVAGSQGGGVAGKDGTPPMIDSLAALVTSSLVQRVDRDGGASRFGMLETVRELALEQLADAGEEDEARAAHAGFYLDLIEEVEPKLWAATSEKLLDGIETEHDNLRLALTWAAANDRDQALRLAGALGGFWSKRSHWSEGRAWLERTLEGDAGAGTAARALALGRLGAIVGDQGDSAEARRYLEACLTLADELGEHSIAARALRGLGIIASDHSEFARAEELFSGALERFRALDNQPGIARSLNDLGLIADRQGDQHGAIAYLEEALPIARAVGDEWLVCVILGNLGGAYSGRRDFVRGQALSEEALELARRLGDTFGIADNLYNLGQCALELGDAVGAIERYRETLLLTHQLGERHLASRTLDRIGVALHQTGLSRTAPRLFGAAAALRESLGDTLFSAEDAILTQQVAQVRDALGEEVFAAAWESGRSLPVEQATAEAIAQGDAALTAHHAQRSHEIAGLTLREFEVLRLLAEGQPDKEIANLLYISPRTASSHVAAIIAKLGVDSRTAAVAAALRRGLV
jgi:excisionase family DNA binding protein